MDEFGCPYCWDSKKEKEKELYFFDAANNFKLCDYCPKCGRKYGEETVNEYMESKQRIANGDTIAV